MRFHLLAFLAVFAAFPASAGQDSDPVTAANWLRHPRIVEVRNIYKDVREGIDKKRLKMEWAKYKYCERGEDTERTIYRDAKGARYYFNSGGSDDSSVSRNFYYDRKGMLRFAFIIGGAVNGTVMEYRIYFDAAGKRIWENRKRVAGPGYTFPKTWPEDDMIRQPDKALYSDHPCPVKAGG